MLFIIRFLVPLLVFGVAIYYLVGWARASDYKSAIKEKTSDLEILEDAANSVPNYNPNDVQAAKTKVETFTSETVL